MKLLFALVGCALLMASHGLHAGEAYRVAGITQLSETRFVALMEGPDGDQENRRVGDALGDAVIVEITARGVRVILDGEPRFLALSGKPVNLASDAADAADQPESLEHEPVSIRVSYRQVEEQLLGLQPGGDAEAVARVVHEALGLDTSSRIVSVDHQAVASAAELVDALLRDLTTNTGLRVVVEKDGKPQRVYFSDE